LADQCDDAVRTACQRVEDRGGLVLAAEEKGGVRFLLCRQTIGGPEAPPPLFVGGYVFFERPLYRGEVFGRSPIEPDEDQAICRAQPEPRWRGPLQDHKLLAQKCRFGLASRMRPEQSDQQTAE
jgi:hypothetical protein